MQGQKPGIHPMVQAHALSNNVQSELVRLSEELAAGKLVKNLTLFPALQITLVHPDMTREFEQACQVLYSDPLLLLGKAFFLAILTMRSGLFCHFGHLRLIVDDRRFSLKNLFSTRFSKKI